MLFDAIFYILGSVLAIVAAIAPAWVIWPDAVYDGLEYFASAIAKLNFLLPVDTLFACIDFFITFLAAYYSARLLISIINWARGAGKLEI